MYCHLHGKPYQYLCKSYNCDLAILCIQCRKLHLMQSQSQRTTHSAQIIPLPHIYQQVNKNLQTNLTHLKSMITPIQNQQLISQKIANQKQLLLSQRDQILKKITDIFTKQISNLQNQNKLLSHQNKQNLPLQQINQQILYLSHLQQQYKNNINKLKQAIKYKQENYLNQLRRNNPILSSMKIQLNQYYLYDQIKHDFFISQLQLKKKIINNKLLDKISNSSNKYFLIDNQKFKYGKFLHFFSPTENMLRIFDLQTQKWKKIPAPQNIVIPSYGATLYDNKTGRFYLVGGQFQQQIKSNLILWYSLTKGWQHSQMTKARSSAMITSLQDKLGNTYILIAGGVGEDRRHMKHCQIFNPNLGTCTPTSPMNFAVTSGALVTFDQSTAFRIGGLGQFKQKMASICQIPQKCNYSKYLQTLSKTSQFKPNQSSQSQNPKWLYIQIQVINSQVTKKYNLFYAHQAAIQINPNQIFIFGGMTHDIKGVNQTYILGQQTYRYYARWINQKPLISAQAFNNLRPIIYNKKVVSLQNISCDDNQNQYYQKQKRLIEFNMYEWRQIQNIVNQ